MLLDELQYTILNYILDIFKLNDKTLKQDKKEEKPLIVSIDSNKENESKKSSLGMILFALIMGFIIGVVVWSIFRLSLVLTDLIWETTFTLVNFYWMPLIICVVGGICIGLVFADTILLYTFVDVLKFDKFLSKIFISFIVIFATYFFNKNILKNGDVK